MATDPELKTVLVRLADMEREVSNLRQSYLVVNKRYSDSLLSLRKLTAHAKEAAAAAAAATAQHAEEVSLQASAQAAASAHEAAEAAAEAVRLAHEAGQSARRAGRSEKT